MFLVRMEIRPMFLFCRLLFKSLKVYCFSYIFFALGVNKRETMKIVSNENKAAKKQSQKPKKRKLTEVISKIKKTNEKASKNRNGIPRSITFKQLVQYKDLLKAIGNSQDSDETYAILKSIQDKEFNVVCTCLKNIVQERGEFKGKLSEEKNAQLKEDLIPVKHDLDNLFSNNKTILSKKRLLARRQKGGSDLGNIIASIIPVAAALLL